MDIRTKLVFALVAVALGSMAALGVVLSLGAMDALRESRLQQLDGLAEAKKEGLEQVLAGWEDRVRLVATRTQLRRSVDTYLRTGDPADRLAMERTLADVLDAAAGVESLVVRSLDGAQVASVSRNGVASPGPDPGETPEVPAGDATGGEALGTPRGGAEPLADPAGDDLTYEGVTFAGDRARVGFRAPLVLEGEAVGFLHVRLTPREVFELAAIRTGLGDTGETLLVLPGRDGTFRTIRPSGDGHATLSPAGDPARAPDPVRLALEGREGRFQSGLTDADGDRVWAAVRHLPGPGWGLVVKLDAEEGRAPVVALRKDLTRVALSLGAFAILAGVVLGFRFTRPILDLSAVADRIRAGELGARASVASHDEIGLLARTFNGMAEELEERMTELREFQTFFEMSRDLLCIAGTDGYFKRVNPAFEGTLGWSEETLLSRPIPEFVHPGDVDRTIREIERLSEGVPTVAFENRFAHAAGGYRRLRWTCHPEPETGLLYAVARDIGGTDDARSGGERRHPTPSVP